MVRLLIRRFPLLDCNVSYTGFTFTTVINITNLDLLLSTDTKSEFCCNKSAKLDKRQLDWRTIYVRKSVMLDLSSRPPVHLWLGHSLAQVRRLALPTAPSRREKFTPSDEPMGAAV